MENTKKKSDPRARYSGCGQGCCKKPSAKPVDLKADDTVYPVTDDQIITEEFLDAFDKSLGGFISKFIPKSLAPMPVDKKDSDKKESTTTAVKTVRPSYAYQSYSSYNRHNDGYMQPSGMTAEERYPKIYDSAVTLKPKAKRVLSFGCSTGEEAFALAKRFPDTAQIVGVDIDHNRVVTARRNNKNKNVFFHDNVGALGQFDVVTALNVFFCLDKPIPKDNWKKTLEEVAGYVAPGGVLMIFKSDYNPEEVLGGLEFKAENIWNHTHNRNNKDYFCGYYRKKSKSWWQ